ncbi:uncharacterized protein ACNS7B_005306 isoform 1-T1 [Menidia menidia]
MRVLWIVCLLTGSISCLPQQDAVWSAQAPSRPAHQKPSGSWTQQYGGQGGQSGAPGGHQQAEEGSWSLSSDTSGRDEPVFTPVSDEEQVYARKSRFHYNRQRARFTQFHYTPTESQEAEQGKGSQQSKGQVQRGF